MGNSRNTLVYIKSRQWPKERSLLKNGIQVRNTQSMQEGAWAILCGSREEGLRAEVALVNEAAQVSRNSQMQVF